MTIIQKSIVVPYTPEQMYDLVNAIEHYPDYLPWCSATTIHSRTEDEVRATIHLEKSGIKHSFSTINRLQPHKMIEIRLLTGPFKHLEGYWRFDEVKEGCLVHFDVEFVFQSRLLDGLMGPMLKGVMGSFVEAFSKRAKELYGR